VGFEAILSNGEKGIFAHKEKILSKYAVGDYQVDLEMIDKLFTVNILSELKEPRRLLIVDEIGRMEMLSERFVQAIDALFEANVSVLATIRQGDSWAEKYKTHPGVTVIEVTEQNRERLPEELVEAFLET
jgi:nucleoside-triphosphatase